MSTSVVTRPKTAIEKMKDTIAMPSVQEQFKNALADNSALFVASLIDVYASDTYLQKCEPGLVIMEALKAATLRLPINKSLGFAYIVPYDKSVKVGDQWVKKSTPQFQIGYKGYIQLAQRTGQYRYLNADVVLDGELKGHDKLTGTIDLSGETSTGEVIGYFAHIETVTGFRKTVYWSKSRVEAHALRYSQAYQADVKSKKQNSPWSKQFDEMATKTVLKALLSKYGVMSVEMVAAMTADTSDETTPEQRLDIDVTESANKDFLDIEPESVGTEAEKGQDNPPPDKDWPPAELPPIRTDGDSFREQRAVIDSRQTKPAATKASGIIKYRAS